MGASGISRAAPAAPGLAHGMGTEPVAPDWPALTPDEIDRLLARYPAAGPVREVLFYSPRPFSAASLVATVRGAVFVKRHHRLIRDPAGLAEEHRFIAHLRRTGLPVPDVLVNDRDETATASGDWTYEVHTLADGLDLYRDALSWTPFVSPDHAWSAGAALARLHRAAAGFSAPSRAVRPLVSSFTIAASADLGPALTAYVAARPGLAGFLATQPGWHGAILAALGPHHRSLRPFLARMRPSWTHNDWHASNLTWSDAGSRASVRMILDFGLADRTTALFDLATAIERNAVEWLRLPESDVAHPDLAAGLMAGYDSVLPLAPWQRRAVAALLPLVHVEFALAETDYFHAVVGSPDNALLAFDPFLFGHVRWFESEQGRDFLAGIGAGPAGI
jgi:Ser/Thr protein kinase RdoA (MazF antagonist)